MGIVYYDGDIPMIWYWYWRWYSSGWYMIFDVWYLITYLMMHNIVNCILWWWYTYCMILVLKMIFQWLVYDIWCFGSVFNVWKRFETYLMNVYIGNCIVWWWYTYCVILVLMVLYLFLWVYMIFDVYNIWKRIWWMCIFENVYYDGVIPIDVWNMIVWKCI